MCKLSIVMLAFNKANFTKSALDDLSHLNKDETEIIVVNNASSDETADRLLEYQKKLPNLKIISNSINLKFAKGCNQGFVASLGTHVMFLNNDIRVKDKHASWVNDLMQHCTDDCVVGPTGARVDPKNNFQFLYETNDPNKINDINYLAGWCVIAKRTVWDRLILNTNEFKGPFSEEFHFYFEDTDLFFRCATLSPKIKLIMQPVPVIHFGKISSRQLNVNELYSKARQIFIKKWSKSNVIVK